MCRVTSLAASFQFGGAGGNCPLVRNAAGLIPDPRPCCAPSGRQRPVETVQPLDKKSACSEAPRRAENPKPTGASLAAFSSPGLVPNDQDTRYPAKHSARLVNRQPVSAVATTLAYLPRDQGVNLHFAPRNRLTKPELSATRFLLPVCFIPGQGRWTASDGLPSSLCQLSYQKE
jgi:hypothetical protein